MNKPEIELLFDDASGIYIPQRFAQEIDREAVTGVSEEDFEILNDPDHEFYWDAWADVLDTAIITDIHGTQYTLYQDGDVWLIPIGMEWSEKDEFFVWPDETEKD